VFSILPTVPILEHSGTNKTSDKSNKRLTLIFSSSYIQACPAYAGQSRSSIDEEAYRSKRIEFDA